MTDHAVDALAYALHSTGGRNTEGGALTGQAAFSPRARAQDEHELHTEDAHAVIAAELVACTLGARRRPELEVGVVASIARAMRSVVEALRPIRNLFVPPPSRTDRLRAWLAR